MALAGVSVAHTNGGDQRGSGVAYAVVGDLCHVRGPKLNHPSRSSLKLKQSRLGLPGTIKAGNTLLHTSPFS